MGLDWNEMHRVGSVVLPTGGVNWTNRTISFFNRRNDLLLENASFSWDTNGRYDTFMYDDAAGQTQLVSHHEGNPLKASAGSSANASLSADGSTVLFTSSAFDIDGDAGAKDPYQFFSYNVPLQQARALPHTRWSPFPDASVLPISADGARIAYPVFAIPDEPSPALQRGTYLMVHDRDAQALETVVESSKLPLYTFDSDLIARVTLSADGRTVAFVSNAADLVRGLHDGNGVHDVFIATRHDRIFRAGFE